MARVALSVILMLICLADLSPAEARMRNAADIEMKTTDGRKVVMPKNYICPPILSEYLDQYSITGGDRLKSKLFRQLHQGQDIVAPLGTKVYASCDGVVEISDFHWAGGERTVVKCDHNPLDHRTIYEVGYHYSKRLAKKADRVRQGETMLGLLGFTGEGRGPAPHYHRELRAASGWNLIEASPDRKRIGMIIWNQGTTVNPHDYWLGAKGAETVVIPPYEAVVRMEPKQGYVYPLRCAKKR